MISPAPSSFDIVANKLTQIALYDATPDSEELFARSTYNRYYYATFHLAKLYLGLLEPKFTFTTHKDAPSYIRERTIRHFKRHFFDMRKKELMTFSEVNEELDTLILLVSRLESTMIDSRSLRTTADYKYHIKIRFHDETFSLDGTSQSEAKLLHETFRNTLMEIIRIADRVQYNFRGRAWN